MKLKNVLIIAMAIVTLGLVVACSDDVVVASKDNNTNFAQVLESNGAFEYNGTKYETLQDAIEAIDKAKGYAPKTIKVLRDGVKTGAATVPSTITGSGIALDLNGNSLSFLSSTGVTVNGVFRVTGNGEITLDDKSADATAFAVGKGGALTVTDTTINVADQYAVKASGEGAAVDLFDGAIIAGNIAASDKAHIDLKSGSVVSGTMSTSDSETVVQVFGTLEGNVDALNSSSIELSNSSSFTGNINVLSGASLTVGSATAGTGPTIGAGSTITVSGANMTANKDAKNAELAMADGATVTVNDGGMIHVSAFDNDTCAIFCDDTKKAEILEDADVNIDPEKITDGFFKVVQDNGQTKYFSVLQDAVNSAVATTNNKKVTYVRDRLNTTGVSAYSTAEVLSALTIDMSGNSDRVDITVSAGTLTVENTSSTKSILVGTLGNGGAGNITIDNVTVGRTTDEVADAVNITGALISTRSTFNATVIAGTLTDGEGSGTAEDPYKNGSTFNGTVNVSGNITLKKSIIAPSITGDDDDFVRSVGSITMYNVAINNEHVGVFAAQGGSVSMTNSTGTAYKIIATNTGSSTLGTITINNSTMTTGSFTVKDEVAARVTVNNTDYYGDVTIKGYVADTPAVSVDKIEARDVNVSYINVTNTNNDASGARARSGNFVSDNSVFYGVVEVFGFGYLKDGVAASTTTTEKVGSTFKNRITVGGTSDFYKSTFDPIPSTGDTLELSAKSVTISSAVFSKNSTTGESTGKLYNITASKTNTAITELTAEDNLTITASTGFVGLLKTTGNALDSSTSILRYYSNIVVDNSTLTSVGTNTLSVGEVWSTDGTDGNTLRGNVTVKGYYAAASETVSEKNAKVTVAKIPYAYDVKTSYAIVNGDIGSDAKKVTSVSDGWTGSPAAEGKSTFNGNIYASGAGTFNNSIFAPTSSGATAGDKNLKALSLSISESTFTKTGTTPTYVYSLEATKEFAAASNAISISSSNGSIGTVSASNAGNISIVSTTGVIGNITSSATKDDSSEPAAGSIVIDNSSFSGTETVNTLSTGSLSSWYAYNKSGSDPYYTYSYVYGDVTVKGGTTANTVTVASIPYADDVKTSYAVVSGDIGFDTTKVKTVSDGWTDSSTVAGYSTFNGNIYANGAGTFKDSRFSASGSDKTLTARNVAINRGVFAKDSSDNRYNVNDSSNTDGGVTINDSTGYLGSVKSDYVITIDNKGATADLYINYRSNDSNKRAIYANGHSIHITGPNASDTKIDITGQISGGVNVNMYAGGTDYDDSSLIVNNIEDRAEIVGPTINIYGGTYYGTGNYAILSGDVNVHKGTFYVGSGEDTALRSVAGNIVNNTDYTVVIKISGNITLSAPLVVGLKNASSFNISPEKNVYFESATGYSYSIKALYNDSDSYATTHYTTVPVVLAGGRIVFNKIRVSLDTCTVETTLNYSYSGSSAFWWKNNGVTVVKATGEETFENPHEFTNNSEIHWNAQ